MGVHLTHEKSVHLKKQFSWRYENFSLYLHRKCLLHKNVLIPREIKFYVSYK